VARLVEGTSIACPNCGSNLSFDGSNLKDARVKAAEHAQMKARMTDLNSRFR
jgi:hypothetical protein